jgi:glycosyltransferase involved in cell wall biosynthesis
VWVTHAVGGCKFTLEAMAAGRPVVAMRNLDLEGLIDGANGILVPPGDAVRMAAVTSGLLANTDRIATTGAAGKRTAKTFTVSALEQAVESVYDGLIRKPV